MNGIDYSSDEFWATAPEWAGAVISSTGQCGEYFYFVEEFGGVSRRQEVGSIDRGEIADMDIPGNAWRLVSERPQPWTGDGLPPVGLTVRIPDEMAGGNAFLAQFEGLNVEIVGHATSQMGNPLAVFQYEDRKGDYRYHAMCGDNGNFEPIRTPEQIAADQRAKAVEKMWSIYWQPHATSAKQALGLLWDAGLRFADESDRG